MTSSWCRRTGWPATSTNSTNGGHFRRREAESSRANNSGWPIRTGLAGARPTRTWRKVGPRLHLRFLLRGSNFETNWLGRGSGELLVQRDGAKRRTRKRDGHQ
jgi:hypothetical protein